MEGSDPEEIYPGDGYGNIVNTNSNASNATSMPEVSAHPAPLAHDPTADAQPAPLPQYQTMDGNFFQGNFDFHRQHQDQQQIDEHRQYEEASVGSAEPEVSFDLMEAPVLHDNSHGFDVRNGGDNGSMSNFSPFTSSSPAGPAPMGSSSAPAGYPNAGVFGSNNVLGAAMANGLGSTLMHLAQGGRRGNFQLEQLLQQQLQQQQHQQFQLPQSQNAHFSQIEHQPNDDNRPPSSLEANENQWYRSSDIFPAVQSATVSQAAEAQEQKPAANEAAGEVTLTSAKTQDEPAQRELENTQEGKGVIVLLDDDDDDEDDAGAAHPASKSASLSGVKRPRPDDASSGQVPGHVGQPILPPGSSLNGYVVGGAGVAGRVHAPIAKPQPKIEEGGLVVGAPQLLPRFPYHKPTWEELIPSRDTIQRVNYDQARQEQERNAEKTYELSLLNMSEFTISGVSNNLYGGPCRIQGLRRTIKECSRGHGNAVFEVDRDGTSTENPDGGKWRIPLVSKNIDLIDVLLTMVVSSATHFSVFYLLLQGAYQSFVLALRARPKTSVIPIDQVQLNVASMGKARMDKGYPSVRKLISFGVPPGLACSLADFQRGGVEFVVEKGGRALIADGKTK